MTTDTNGAGGLPAELETLASGWVRLSNDKYIAHRDREFISGYDEALRRCAKEVRELCRATREGDGEGLADEAMKLADFFEGVRVFVTSRQKIRDPEGTDLFDEHVTRLLRLAGSLRTISRVAVQEGK